MKSDDEIKEWIDSREVVTQTELWKFIYGYSKGDYTPIFTKWWLYVIEYKDLSKLKNYANQKIKDGRFNHELFNKVKSVYDSDARLRDLGYRLGARLLKNVYGIEIAKTTYHSYKRKIEKNELV